MSKNAGATGGSTRFRDPRRKVRKSTPRISSLVQAVSDGHSGYGEHHQGLLRKIFTRFPTVFVDYTVQQPDNRAITPRYPWIGSDLSFEPGRLCIMLNGHVSSILAECLTDV